MTKRPERRNGKNGGAGKGPQPGAQQGAPKPEPERAATPPPKQPEVTPSEFTTLIANNRGWLGANRGYTIGDLKDVSDAVAKHLEEYNDDIPKVSVNVGTKYSRLGSLDAFRFYDAKNDNVRGGSHLLFESGDHSLKCGLYVGWPSLLKIDSEVPDLMSDEEMLWEGAKRIGRNYGTDLAIILATSIVGGAIAHVGRLGKIGLVVGFGGKVLRTGGKLYGLGDMVRNTWNELVPTGVCTLKLTPQGDFTPEQTNRYRSLVGKLEGYKAVGTE